MDGKQRRERLLGIIASSAEPVTGAALAAALEVSRQVIVSDVALLRSSGIQILATPGGYLLLLATPEREPTRVFSCRHDSMDAVRQELLTIIEAGGKVRNVIVDHPVYGEITGELMISKPSEVERFLEKLEQTEAEPLSAVTHGMHYHSVEADSEELLDQIEEGLRQIGVLQE